MTTEYEMLLNEKNSLQTALRKLTIRFEEERDHYQRRIYNLEKQIERLSRDTVAETEYDLRHAG